MRLFTMLAVVATLFIAPAAMGAEPPGVLDTDVSVLVPTVAPAPPTTGATALSTLMVPLVGALGMVLTALFAFLAALLKNKSQEASISAGGKLAAALGGKASTIMQQVVSNLWAEFREPLEEAAKDGILDSAEKQKLREAAVSKFLSALGDAFKGQLMGAIGVNEAGLKTYAAGLVEQAVGTVKAEKAREASFRAQAESIEAEATAKRLQHERTASDILAHFAATKREQLAATTTPVESK